MSSPCLVVGERPPHAVEMLEEVYKLSWRDCDVLAQCVVDKQLSRAACKDGRLESALKLEKAGYFTFEFHEQMWYPTVLARRVIRSIGYNIYQYEPRSKGKAELLHFPRPSA